MVFSLPGAGGGGDVGGDGDSWDRNEGNGDWEEASDKQMDRVKRKLMFAAEPGWIAPSDTTLIKNCDKKAAEIRELLKQDIKKDLDEAEHKVVSVTIDGGTSKDNKKQKRMLPAVRWDGKIRDVCNSVHPCRRAVTLHRTTSDFELKSDTLAVVKISRSQNGEDVRRQLKEVLVKYGYDSSWIINPTTDGAKVMISARAPGRHPQVGLKTTFDISCVDHTIHLVVEDSIKGVDILNDAIGKTRAMVTFFVKSGKQRELLLICMAELGLEVLNVQQGTSNRWFFKFMEIERMIILRAAIQLYFDKHGDELPATLEEIEDDEWDNFVPVLILK